MTTRTVRDFPPFGSSAAEDAFAEWYRSAGGGYNLLEAFEAGVRAAGRDHYDAAEPDNARWALWKSLERATADPNGRAWLARKAMFLAGFDGALGSAA